MNGFILASLLFLQTPATQPAEQKEQKLRAQTQKKETEAIGEMMKMSRSVMIIDPKERANDYMKAFEMLRQEKSTSKVFFDLSDGSKISSVIDMKLMPGGSLVIFRYSTPHGIKYQVVEIEDILGIYHQ
ncbi:MAG: hypothetical protein K1000chlam2_00923 [Chlamydiae bacterium]|nr:hypothetical protein [Chlamydiota bacterium]